MLKKWKIKQIDWKKFELELDTKEESEEPRHHRSASGPGTSQTKIGQVETWEAIDIMTSISSELKHLRIQSN
jgi:hypothetical protein